jgi:hypothetical protein
METIEVEDKHGKCSVHEPCEARDASSCPHEFTRRRRAQLKQGRWSALELRREVSGLRHYLDGKPVHCGASLELQHTEDKSDDYGEFTVPLQLGSSVRYEASWVGSELPFSLHRNVGGTEFTAAGELWMRFRWPEVRR